MKPFTSSLPPRLQKGLLQPSFLVALTLFAAGGARAAQQAAQQSPPPLSAGAPAANDEAAKAAERRRRFEEQKRQLEQSETGSPAVAGAEVSADQTLFVSPAVTNMLVGEFREFCVYDIDGKLLTREAEWAIDDPSVASLNDNGEPTITTKRPGKTTLHARVGGRTAQASITVLDGDSLPVGTVKWGVPNYPGYKTKKIVQAVPRERGPDIYTIEENDQQKSLVRAWTSEGIFLWLRKFDRRIVDAVPH